MPVGGVQMDKRVCFTVRLSLSLSLFFQSLFLFHFIMKVLSTFQKMNPDSTL